MPGRVQRGPRKPQNRRKTTQKIIQNPRKSTQNRKPLDTPVMHYNVGVFPGNTDKRTRSIDGGAETTCIWT